MMTNSKVRSFTDLDCWKACRKVRIFIMNFVKILPPDEKYDLKDNIRRAARSATRNLAEGYGRHHFRETAQFCRISRGSLNEVLDDLGIAVEEGYLTSADYESGKDLIENAIRLVNGYIRYLNKSKRPN